MRPRPRTARACAWVVSAAAAWAALPPAPAGPTTAASRPDLAAEANALADTFGKRFWSGYTTRIDQERHLVYVSALEDPIFEGFCRALSAYCDAQQKLLFPRPLQRNVVILLPTVNHFRKLSPAAKVMGYFDQETWTLASISVSSILFHEFTHALHHNDQVLADQNHAAWVCEGLASLFQRSVMREGTLQPEADPSVATLQKAIEEDKAYPISTLCRMDRKAFAEDGQKCYPQARYLMMYLHRLGKVQAFYETYKATYKEDPTAAKALEKALGKPLEKVDADWRTWVLAEKPPWKPAQAQTAYLGVKMEPAADGVKATGFVRGSPAESAKRIEPGDVVISIDGQPTPTPAALTQAVQSCLPGQIVDVEVIRNGRTTVLKQLLGVQPR